MRFFTQKFKKSNLLSVFFMCSSMLFALNGFSQKTVQGIVYEQGTESPIIGANVLVKGSSTGTVTDLDGKFSITLNQGENALIISYVGFAEKEIMVDGQTTILVYLEEAALGLTEVTVTALGITKEKKRITTAIQSVDGSQLVKAREPNNINGLVGKVAGLTIGTSPELLRRPAHQRSARD